VREREQVAVRVQVLAGFAQLLETEFAAQRPLEVGVVAGEQLVLEPLVGLVEVEAGGEPLEHLEQRVDARFDWAFAQQRGREAVDRLDVRPVQVPRRVQQSASLLLVVDLVGPPLQLVTNPGRQLGRCLLGERDHHELINGHDAGGEQARDPPDEHGRLPGAGGGLDAQVRAELPGDPRARERVDQHATGHWTPRIRSANVASRGSAPRRSM
jgi:hypothetical protein